MTSAELLLQKLTQLGETITTVDIPSLVTTTTLAQTLESKNYLTGTSAISANNLIIELPKLNATSECTSCWDGQVTLTDTGFNVKYPENKNNGSAGFKTKDLKIASGKLLLKAKFDKIPAKFSAVLVGTKTDNKQAFLGIADFTNTSANTYTIDLDKLKTEKGLDTSKAFYIACTTASPNTTATVSQFEIYKNNTQLDTTKTLIENIDVLYSRVSTLENANATGQEG